MFMTIGDIAIKARDLLNTNSTDYADANMLIDINIWYQKIANWILEAQDSSDFDDSNNTKYPIFTTPMVALQRDYPITAALRILQEKRLDFTYDGANWYRALPFDDAAESRGLGPVSGATVQDANIDARYTKMSPRYDIKYGSIFIYPRALAADVSAGAAINAEFTRSVCPFSLLNTDTPATTGKQYVGAATLAAGTAEPGFDINCHPILAYGISMEYAEKTNAPQLNYIASRLADYKQELKNYYSYKNTDFKLRFGSIDYPENVIYN